MDARRLITEAREQGRAALDEGAGKQLLAAYGIAVPKAIIVSGAADVDAAFKRLKPPMVVKVMSPDILHKSDANGVKLGLRNKSQVQQAFTQLIKNASEFNADADIHGVLVSPMVQPGVEIIIGTKIDEQFGPIIMYGLGGVMVEILKDISFRVLPITRHSARNMIKETKSYPILNGVRGYPPYDQKALVHLLLLVSDLIEAYPDIQELDLNPVILHHEGLSIVDARIILKEKCMIDINTPRERPCRRT